MPVSLAGWAQRIEKALMSVQRQVAAREQRAPSGFAKALVYLLGALKRWKYVDYYMRQLWRWLPDKMFIKLQFLDRYHRFPDLKNPRTFDEKLQWYKLYYRDPLMTDLTDKYKVREYVKSKGFGGILNELLGIYDKAEDIDPASLPDRFVIKATHGSAMNIICKDKASLDWEAARAQMSKWLKTDYSSCGREWAYRNIRPRLICEKYLENDGHNELIDYKFYCYAGKPHLVFICTGRYSAEGLKYHVYDMHWNRIPVWKGRENSQVAIEKPDTWGVMIDMAGVLSQGFPFMRVDFYSIKGQVIFGELTFYPDSGVCPFTPDEYNFIYGVLFVLPPKLTASP